LQVVSLGSRILGHGVDAHVDGVASGKRPSGARVLPLVSLFFSQHM
jgi:hypothetical protein